MGPRATSVAFGPTKLSDQKYTLAEQLVFWEKEVIACRRRVLLEEQPPVIKDYLEAAQRDLVAALKKCQELRARMPAGPISDMPHRKRGTRGGRKHSKKTRGTLYQDRKAAMKNASLS